ncbi:MAG TPA: hypothetical protein VGE52_03310 [Pirellulales bacterium]
MTISGRLSGVMAGGAAVLTVLALAAAPAVADDFRIESKVFANGEAKAVRENLTLFHRGIVYDYASNPLEITVLDPEPSRARFILLNPARQQKLEIKLSKIEQLINDVRKAGKDIGPDKPFMKFVFDPKFSQDYDAAKKSLLLDSPWMEYKLSTAAAPTPLANDQYRQFSDWFAQLNAITSPTAMPPFARLQVNALLHQNGQVPADVKLTLKGIAPKGKDMIFTSQHQVMWKLLEADMVRIQKTDDMFVKFTAMPPEEYFKEDAPAPTTAENTKPNAPVKK